jgi:tetratricopeptide (TPR) repeat protein
MCMQRSDLDFFRGDWGQARVVLERGAAAVSQMDAMLDWTVKYITCQLGRYALAQGNREAASAHLGEALRLGEATSDPNLSITVQIIQAESTLLAGEPETTRARLEPLIQHARAEPGADDATTLLLMLAWAYLELGDTSLAQTLAAEAVAQAARFRQVDLVQALRVSAQIAIRQQHWQEAASALEETITRCRTMPYPYAEAKALFVYGQLHTAQGEPDRARERYTAALAICARLGERLYAEHIERALAGLAEH